MSEVWQRWEGQVLDVTFPLRKYIGGHGCSAVFLTERREPEPRRAVIKFLLAGPDRVRERLSRMESVAKLSHPSLMRIFQWGLCQQDSSRLLYVVMEYATEVLSDVLQQRSLTSSEMCTVLVPTLDALRYLHGAGFVHGHLKPANIMAVDDQVKISGEGLLWIGEIPSRMEVPSVYDPPETGRGAVSPAGDIWALAVTMVEALTQRLPIWEGAERRLVLPEILPGPFLEIARNCLQEDPKRRWTTHHITERLKQNSLASLESPSISINSKRQYFLRSAVVVMVLVAVMASLVLFHRHLNVLRAISSFTDQPGPQQRPRTKVPVDRLSEPVPYERYSDDVGRFLAGLHAQPGSQLAEFHKADAWVRHSRELDRAWNRLEREPLVAMRAFQKQELSQAALVRSPVFYPFSGPDVLMVTTFFPRSPIYLMVGLEPPGTLPTPKQLGRTDLDRYLTRVRATVIPELDRSFFITREMDRQFRGQVTDGLLLPILELLVRTKHTVLGLQYVRLDDVGQIVARAPGYRLPGSIGNKGVEIDFHTDEDGSVHKLLYFSVNLTNKTLQDNKPFLTFVSGLKRTVTFLKATSYMVHQPEFSIIRDLLLSGSVAVLQDDSGIPYHFFQRPTWRVQLYGEYIRPYGSFRWLEQQDLRRAYLTSSPRTLGFRIGYGDGRIPSHLVLATRKE